MCRDSGNSAIRESLQAALTAYLDDHRAFAHDDPEWLEGFNKMTPEERKQMAGCGCKCCDSAGYLRGHI